MNKNILIIIIIIFGLLLSGVILFRGKPHTEKEHAEQKKEMFHCPMHPNYISDKQGDCPICGMKLVPIKSDQHSSEAGTHEESAEKNAIRIDPVTIQNMGVTTEDAAYRSLTKEIRTGAVISMDETKQGVVSTKIMGWVDRLYVNFTGERVRKGQKLFEIYSPDLVSTQEEYIQAIRYARKLKASDSAGADVLLESTRRRLANWDISEEQILALENMGAAQRTMAIHSPLDGIVIEKNVVEGQNIMSGAPLYKIVDLTKVWVIANVYQSDIPFVKKGMKASIELQAQPGKFYKGTVQYISPILDQESKTAQVRIEVRNTEEFDLKPEMFANVEISSEVTTHAISVPDQAVIRTGERNIVILDIGNGYFKPQDVRIGISANGYTQILEGLLENQTVVTSSQFLIDSESNLKAAVEQMSSTGHNHGATDMSQEQNDTLHKEGVAADHNVTAPTEKKNNGTGEEWICTMCPEVKSDKPGKCPICGMFLTKKE